MKAGDVEIRTFDTSHPDEESFVRAELDRFNHANGPFDEIRLLRCFARSPSGELLGAAIGHTWGAASELGQIWVAEAQRRRGIGGRLLHAFEAEARTRGCDLIYLDTFSFNALQFYESNGYEVACRLGGLPKREALFILQKALIAA